MHRDGFGFVVPDAKSLSGRFKSIVGDIFIAPHVIGNAMHGDRVLVDVTNIRPDGRAEGRIVRPVFRAHPTVVGVFHYGSRHNYVTPFDSKITQEIVIPAGMEFPATEETAENTTPQRAQRTQRKKQSADRVLGDEAARHCEWSDLEGVVVDVEITDWPSATQNPRGRVIEILGREDDFGVDVEITIRKFHLPHHFPAAVLEEADEFRLRFRPMNASGRRDFRALPIVTIDGETASDFDDAVLVRVLPNQNYCIACPYCRRCPVRHAGLGAGSRKRGCAVLACIFPTAPSPCCRSNSRPTFAACVPISTGWCSPR